MPVNKTARRPQRPRSGLGRADRHATFKDAFARAYNEKRYAEAERHARALTEQRPDDAFAWQALGAARFEQRSPDATSALHRSLQLDPGNAQTRLIMGKAQMAAKNWQAAADHLRACLEVERDNAFAHLHLARTLRTLGDSDGAVKHIDQAHALTPENTTILASRINIHASARKVETVLDDCKRLLELDDQNASFFNLAAIKHSDVGLFEEAESYYSHALECAPSHLIAFSNRIFNAHYNPAHDNAAIGDLIRQWRTVFSPSTRPARPRPDDPDGERKLTVGLLSAGLRNHPVGQMITTALENLPADQFELVAYSSSDAQDHVTRRLRRITPRWRFVTDMDDDALAQRIRDDHVDILIDLSGHTDGNRLTMIAMEPAPLIAKWVGGLVNTTGLDAIDYLISDSIETPPGCDQDYYEKLIRLPDDYICYLPPGHAPDVKALPALSAGYITFGCLNNPAKINPALIREWSRLLREIDSSRLLLKGAQYLDEGFCERIWRQFEDAGIDRERVTLEGPEKHTAFLDTYNRIDIALDPWPYSGGLTTCEALLMGVPVITLPGPTFAGRHAASHLINAGLPELVVDSWEAYRARAHDLAGDLDNLATVRRHLRDTLLQSPVCDAPRFAAHLSAALRGIWQRYCRDLPPAALTFSQDGTAQFEDQALPVPEPTVPSTTLVKAAARREAGDQFHFDFSGKIVALDNGGQLLETGAADTLLRLGAFELLVFDPLGEHASHAARQRDGLQVFPQTTLGDGEPAVHYACLDPAFSATLKPLPDAGDGARVLTELPVNTVALDSIEGLPSLDWLVLDHRSDSIAVLENGANALANTLLIQATLRFDVRHAGQPDLPKLCQWAQTHGFRLYRLNNPTHRSHLPEEMGPDRQATELVASEALLLPTPRALSALDDNRKVRLAFLLHTVYGIKDLAYALLEQVDPQQAHAYLDADGGLQRPFTEPAVFVVGCGHSGTTLMASLLGAHPNIYCLPRETYWFLNNPKLDQEYPQARRDAADEGKTLVCEKTPKHVYRIDEIKRRFPNARFVAMVRDGRDVACSIKKRTGSLDGGIQRWRQDNTELLKHENDDHVHRVRYEDLIQDKEGTMAGVLAFLGQQYTDEVFGFYKKNYNWFGVQPAKETDGVGEQSHVMRRSWQMSQPIHDRRGIWRESLSEQEAKRFEAQCADLMRHFGYL